MRSTRSRQSSSTGPVWQTLFNNTYPHFGNRRNRATIVRDIDVAQADRQQPALPPQRVQNLELPQVQNVEPPAQIIEPPAQPVEPPVQAIEPPAQHAEPSAQNVEPPTQAESGTAARAPSPDPTPGQNTPEAVQQPVPRGRSRRQNIPRAEQRPSQNDEMPQGHDESVNLQQPNPHERLNRTNNSGASRRRSRDDNRPGAYPEPLFVRRPSNPHERLNRTSNSGASRGRSRDNNRPEAYAEPLFVQRPNMQGHDEARHRRESPGPRQQRWARDIENSRGRGNSRSDARIIVENDTDSNASSSGSEDFMIDTAPPIHPLNVDWETTDAYFETSSTTSAIDDSRESRIGSTEDALQQAETNARRNEGPLLNNPDSDHSTEDLRLAHQRSNRNERHVQGPLFAYRGGTHGQEPLIVHRNRKKNKMPVRKGTTEGLRGILKTNNSSYRRPSVSEGNER